MNLLESGTNLEGKYEILDRLEGGGMGEVYRVRHLHLQELRVIKLLRRDLARDPTASQRFHREARTATQIKHPHVATLYDYSRLPDGRFYMVWEYISGDDLASWLRRSGPFPLSEALELGIQALRGLEAIHSAHVIHRDISPDNLMITKDRQARPWIKIVDLGLAKSLTEPSSLENQAAAFGGKLRYCSPEQAGLIEGGLDHRSDLYSFALVLYEAITGLLPFDVDKGPGVILQRFRSPPLPLRGRNPEVDVPDALDAVIRRALAYYRDDRFHDASSFANALSAIAEGLPEAGLAPPSQTVPDELHSTGVSRGISEGEKRRILSGIGAASQRIEESSRLIGKAEKAIREGKFDTARSVIQQLEEMDTQVLGLAELKKRLREVEVRRLHAQVMQTEEILEQYLLSKQHTLAQMALDTLLELKPDYENRQEIEARIEAISQDELQRRSVKELVSAVQQAITQGNLSLARRQLTLLQSDDAKAHIGRLERQIEAAEEAQRRSLVVEELKERVEALLSSHQFEAAEAALEELAKLEVPKVVLDLFRGRLGEIRAGDQRQLDAVNVEEQYRAELSAGHWTQARELALKLETLLPDSELPGQMFAEVAALQDEDRKNRAFAEGVAAFEGFLSEGQVTQAEIAWKVLRDLRPDHPEIKNYEKRLRTLRAP